MIPEPMLRIGPHSIKGPGFVGHRTSAPRRIAAAVVLAFCPLTIFACGKANGNFKDSIVVVVLASGTRNESQPELGSPDLAILDNAATSGVNAIAYVVNQNTGQPVKVPLTPVRPDGQIDNGPDRHNRITANLTQVQRVVRDSTADVPYDLLSFIAEAVRVTPIPGTLIVVSSGLSTAGAFDLRQIGWGASPAAAAAALKKNGMLPDLAHWRVVFSNLGTTTEPQAALPLAQRAELTSYWLAICMAAGAASCQVDTVTRPDPPSHSELPVPVVPIPRVTPVQGPQGSTGPSIPADTFFAFGSYALLPGADAILRPIAAKVRAERLDVEILGFASPETGTPAFNRWLSTKRAEAVSSRLLALGVAAGQIVTVRGEGTGGKTAATCYPQGHLDETVCSQLRRVVVLLRQNPGDSH